MLYPVKLYQHQGEIKLKSFDPECRSELYPAHQDN